MPRTTAHLSRCYGIDAGHRLCYQTLAGEQFEVLGFGEGYGVLDLARPTASTMPFAVNDYDSTLLSPPTSSLMKPWQYRVLGYLLLCAVFGAAGAGFITLH